MISTPTLLTSNFSLANATSYPTASISPPAGSIVLVFVVSDFLTVGDDVGATIAGFTRYRDGSGFGRHFSWFRSNGTPGTGALTIDFGAGNDQTACSWIVVEVTSGYNTINPLVNDDAGSGTGTAPAVTLNPVPAATSAVFVGLVTDALNNHTPPSGMIEIVEVDVDDTVETDHTSAVSYQVGSVATTLTGSLSASTGWLYIAIELAAAAASGGQPPRSGQQSRHRRV